MTDIEHILIIMIAAFVGSTFWFAIEADIYKTWADHYRHWKNIFHDDAGKFLDDNLKLVDEVNRLKTKLPKRDKNGRFRS